MASVDWKGKFQDCTITHLVSHASDHLPLLMQTRSDNENWGYGARGFKFEESWLLWDDCERIVEEAWNSGGETGVMAQTCMHGALRKPTQILKKLRSYRNTWRD